MDKQELLAAIASRKVSPRSIAVASQGVTPQEIAAATPQPEFMVGCLDEINPENWQELFPGEPHPSENSNRPYIFIV